MNFRFPLLSPQHTASLPAHVHVLLDPDIPDYCLLILHMPCCFTPPCLSFTYYVLNCSVAPNAFIKSYLSLTSQPECCLRDIFPLQVTCFCLAQLVFAEILLGD